MIAGIGIDIVELERIKRVYERFGKKFLNKFLAPDEQPETTDYLASWLAGRFASKEAASKALGTGFSKGVSPHDFIVSSTCSGKPQLVLQGNARILAAALEIRHLHLSISHERQFAIAMVIMEK